MLMVTLAMTVVTLAMTVVTLAWFGLHYYLNPPIENPDGIARETASCGDTMEVALKFNGSRVADVRCWTDGCAISKMCVETVGMLSRGKTVPELRSIDIPAIMERVGELPDTHIHCAVLAERTLQKAVTVYELKNRDFTSRGTKGREKQLRNDSQNLQVATATRGEPKYIVYIFPSSNYVMKAEKILKERGIAHKIIPVPRHIRSDCGVCLRLMADQQETVTEILREKVAWENIATL